MEIASSYLTLAGAAFGRRPAHNVHARSVAAAHAGFDGIGLSDADLPFTGDGDSLPCPVREVEWFDLAKPDWQVLASLLATAGRLGTVDRLHVGAAFLPASGAEARNLARAAVMAAEHGIRVAVEPVTFGPFPSLAAVSELIADAGAPEGAGVLYDTWQVYRRERKLPLVSATEIASVQVAGTRAHEHASILADAMDRTWPTAGVDADDVSAFLAAIQAGGYAGPVAVEAPNARHRAQHTACAVIARAAYATTVDAL